MKVLILNWRCPSNPASGGAEKVTLEHARAWVKKGIQVTWLAGRYKNCRNVEKFEGVKVIRYGTPILLYLLVPFIYWLKFKGNFDLVIDEIHGIPFLSSLWAWKSKKLVYIHEVAKEIWDEMLPYPINYFGKIYEKFYFFLYKNTPFLTGSNSTKKDLIEYGVSQKNITVIPHGLFLKPVKDIPKKEKSLTLIYVSRLVKMKGIEDALKIFAQILRKMPEAKFWIVGWGDSYYVRKLKNLAKELNVQDNVIFFGYVSEKEKIMLYQKSHFLLHTSVREGFGLVVIEANSQGTPALAYDSPGLRDIIKNGINGYIYETKDYQKVASGCLSLYKSHEYNTLSRTSIISSKKYDWKKITARSLRLLNSIII